MGDAHGGISGVDRLAAGAGGAERVDANVLGLDLDVDFLGLRENGDGDRRGVNAALGLRGGNALHAMHAALPLELGVDALAFDDGDHFLVTADAGF